MIRIGSAVNYPRFAIDEHFKGKRIAMRMPHRILRPRVPGIEHHLDNTASAIALHKIIAGIRKVLTIPGDRSEALFRTGEESILVLCDIVA